MIHMIQIHQSTFNLNIMKRIILSVIVLLCMSSVAGQSTDVVYKVTNYSINGENYDDIALEEDVSLAFYLNEEESLCFANVWRNSQSESYGKVYSLKKTETAETDSTYAMNEIKFTWNFVNSYNVETGNAAVTIQNFFFENTVLFSAKIIVMDTMEVLKMKGYLE